MDSNNLSVPEPILRARVAIIRDHTEAEREISVKRSRDLAAARAHSWGLKNSLYLSLAMNIALIVALIRLILVSGDMDMVGKIGFTICLLIIGTLPGFRLWMLFKEAR